MTVIADNSALCRQVGGRHYADKQQYQPWLIWEHWLELGPYVHSALKYLLRVKCSRLDDLKKASHCLDYQIERLSGPCGRAIHAFDCLLMLRCPRKGTYDAHSIIRHFPELSPCEVDAVWHLLKPSFSRSQRIANLQEARRYIGHSIGLMATSRELATRWDAVGTPQTAHRLFPEVPDE